MRFVGLVMSLMIIGSLWLAAPTVAQQETERCLLLIDFGDGTLRWAEVEVTEGMSAFNVTINGAESLGLTVDYVESSYGVFVNGIGGVAGNWPNEWWHLWIWDSPAEEWEMAMLGAADVPAQGLTALAWSYAMDREDFSSEKPLATPDMQYPWTSFRHDIRNSAWSQSESPIEGVVNLDLNLSNGPISTSPVVADGRIYAVTSGIYDYTSMAYDSNATLTCLDESGEELWISQISGAWGFQIASPLLTDSLVVVPATDAKLYAFDRFTGTERWRADVGSAGSLLTSSPILYRNQIIIGSGDGSVHSFDLNGGLLWRTEVSSAIYFSSPAARDGVVYIGCEEGKLHAVQANGTGELWNVTVNASGRVRSAPLLLDAEIVVTYSIYEGFVAIDGGAVALSYDGDRLWEIRTNATSTSAAAAPGGIVVSSDDGLTFLNTDGDVVWTRSLGSPVKGSPAVSENGMYVTTHDQLSMVYAVDFSGNVMWSSSLEPAQYSMCSPTISDGVVYVTSDNGHLYAFVQAEPKDDGSSLIVILVVFGILFTVLLIAAVGNWIGSRRQD